RSVGEVAGRDLHGLAVRFEQELATLEASGSTAFRDVTQARRAIDVALRHVPPAYRRFHADLLAHQPDDQIFTPFFLAAACEMTLSTVSAGALPPEDRPTLAAAVVQNLNDYVGYRPVAILDSRTSGESYEHERVRPIPLYFRGAGVAAGPYQEIVRTAFSILSKTDPDLLDDASFDIELLDELAFDPRAYDHNHPANRRPNFIFGEWDPHQIDNQGRYRRFVVRQT